MKDNYILKGIAGKKIEAGDLVCYSFGTHSSLYLGIPIYRTDYTVRTYRMRGGGYRKGIEENVNHRMSVGQSKSSLFVKLLYTAQSEPVVSEYYEALNYLEDKYGSWIRSD